MNSITVFPVQFQIISGAYCDCDILWLTASKLGKSNDCEEKDNEDGNEETAEGTNTMLCYY